MAQTELEGRQRFDLYCESIGEHFVIDVAVLGGTQEPLPAVYLTDGNMLFPIIALLTIGAT